MNENSSEGSTGSSSATDAIAEAFLFVAMIYSSRTFALIITEVSYRWPRASVNESSVLEAASSRIVFAANTVWPLTDIDTLRLMVVGYL
jgi:hypothetical protein